MATRAIEAAPLDVILAALPDLPRAVLSHLAARMIERLDEIDGDGELEAEPDLEDSHDAEDDRGADGDEGAHGMDQRDILGPHGATWREP